MAVADPLRFALVLAGCLLASSAPAQGSVEAWLDTMSEAMRTLNYEGELIYRHGDSIKVLHMIHTVRQGQERERLISLNGVPREVVRDQHSVRCVLPDAKAVSVDRRGGGYGFPSLLPLSAQELGEVYRIRPSDVSRVAGRPVRGIDIEPVDDYRYGHRLYLDQEHHLPLKQEVVDASGRQVSLLMYSRIKVDPGLPFEASSQSVDSQGFSLIEHEPRQEVDRQDRQRWQLSRLPPGFQVNHRDLRRDEQGQTLEHLVLSDGLASVSLYIEQSQPDSLFEGASSMGAVNLFGRVLADYQIVAVGEVPEATTRFIAEAVELRP